MQEHVKFNGANEILESRSNMLLSANNIPPVDGSTKAHDVRETSTQNGGENDEQDLAEKLGDAHLNILPKKKMIICLATMSLGLFISFVDQTGITIALPRVAKDLNAETTINWAGTSSLLANCVCQVLVGRFADIFGRKTVLLYSFFLLAVADLACGLARTGVQFFIFRACCGIANGGIQLLTNIIISDIVVLKKRAKYYGILSSSIGLANCTGPLILAGFIKSSTWRTFYYIMPAICFLVASTIYFVVSKNKKEKLDILTRREKFKKIDYLGFIFSSAGLILLLIPISGGGSTYKWSSSLIIAMFIVGGLCLIGFLLIEWKIPRLPMIPLGLFKSPLLSLVLSTNFLYGMTYYSFMYYVPYYFQIVRGYDPIMASVLLIPLVLTQAITSIISGQIISYTGHYKYVILFGYGSWVLGCGLVLLWNETISIGVVIVVLIIMGVGLGFTFQPCMVAAQAQARKSERAVVIGTRNVIRSFGGAIGIAMGSLIVSNTLLKEVNQALVHREKYANIPSDYLKYLKLHIYTRIEVTGLNEKQVKVIESMYMKSLMNYFYLGIPLIGICFISSFFLKDRGVQCIDEQPEPKDKEKNIESK